MILSRLIPLLNVEDVSASIDFFRNALGFEVERQFEDKSGLVWAQLTHGDVVFMINRPDQAKSDHRRVRPSYGETVFYFTVPDIHAAHQDLIEKGYDAGPIERQAYGVDEFTLRDPDGYEFAFAAQYGHDDGDGDGGE